jgi:hypothetical protein
MWVILRNDDAGYITYCDNTGYITYCDNVGCMILELYIIGWTPVFWTDDSGYRFYRNIKKVVLISNRETVGTFFVTYRLIV